MGKKRKKRAVKNYRDAEQKEVKFAPLRWIQKNDVVVKLYISFAFVLVFICILTGLIFMYLYQKNYIRSYTKLLTRQGKIISRRVSDFVYREDEKKFRRYNVYVDELERAEKTDVWIVSKKEAKNPLPEEYINADVDEQNVSKGMQKLLVETFENGGVHSISEYDSTYGMTTLSVVGMI